jgi:hypothetical protein
MKHPALGTDPQVLCAVACTGKSWQQAVRHCCAHSLHVQLHSKAADVRQLRSFACWLSKHAALVNSIDISLHPATMKLGWYEEFTPAWTAVQELRQAVEAAAWMQAPAVPGPSTVASVQQKQTHKQQQPQPGPLRLASFGSNLPDAPGMLAALPAHSLTCLKLHLLSTTVHDGSALSVALAQLSNLQQLQLRGSNRAPGSCVAGIAQLSSLTSLHIGGQWEIKQKHLQQAFAQPLQLRVLQLDLQHLPALNLAALSQLEVLSTPISVDIDETWVFPGHVQQLELGSISTVKSLAALTDLQQLQRLRFEGCWDDDNPDLMLALGQLPALQHLELKFADAACGVETVVALPQLPQLSALAIGFRWRDPSYEDWDEIIEAVAACSDLTRLEMETGAVEEQLSASEENEFEGEEWCEAVAACGMLAGLTNLKDLCVCGRLVTGDALALTALTGLTRLVLEQLGDGVGDTAACALACSLKQLRHLNLKQCGLRGMACLRGIAHLTQLTELCLEGNEGLTPQGLMLLARLSNLRWIGVNVGDGVTQEDVEVFKAHVPGVDVEAVKTREVLKGTREVLKLVHLV